MKERTQLFVYENSYCTKCDHRILAKIGEVKNLKSRQIFQTFYNFHKQQIGDTSKNECSPPHKKSLRLFNSSLHVYVHPCMDMQREEEKKKQHLGYLIENYKQVGEIILFASSKIVKVNDVYSLNSEKINETCND